jgi:hypothetical protein
MQTTKYVLWTALGVAAVLLLTSEKARGIRANLEDKAKENTKKWKSKLSKIGSDSSDTITELRNMLSTEIDGLSEDTRKRIENILDGTTKSAGRMKRSVSNQFS